MGIPNNLIDLEKQRSELLERTLSSKSNFQKLVFYFNYFNQILSLNNSNLNEAFLSEFLDDYVLILSKFDVFGTDPAQTNLIIEQLGKLLTLPITKSYQEEISTIKERIENNYAQLMDVLNGKEAEGKKTDNQAYFPLIHTEITDGFYGVMESITVRINKTDHSDKLIIIPSEKEIEKKISEQCKRSWIVAFGLLKKYVKKPYKYHEIIISFDRKEGIYEGNSLGIALTLSFLEQLLKFYNPLYFINIKEQSTFTGGVTEIGEILCTGEDIIKSKAGTVFFSKTNSFVFPKCEETFVSSKLTGLKERYPERKLKLIPVENINDILNRRDLVEIRKRNLVVRSSRFIKKNWISAIAVVLLSFLFSYLYLIDWDRNPDSIYADGNYIYVINKSGKLLWSVKQTTPKQVYLNKTSLGNAIRLIDVDNDNIKEIIYTKGDTPDDHSEASIPQIMCIKDLSDTLWTYEFRDSVISDREVLSSEYGISILDNTKMNGNDILILWATNTTSFSNAVFLLDPKTGKRINKTHWLSGHITCGMLFDINHDGIQDLVMGGIDNGYEQAVLWGVEFSQMNGYRETIPSYIIRGKKKSQLLFYIRIPKLDYENYMGFRTPSVEQGSLHYIKEDNQFRFGTASFRDRSMFDMISLMDYRLKSNLVDFNIYVGSPFRVLRDTLVAKGKLNKPFTDTKEYIEQQKDRILYLYNDKWVHRKELK